MSLSRWTTSGAVAVAEALREPDDPRCRAVGIEHLLFERGHYGVLNRIELATTMRCGVELERPADRA